MNARSLVAVLAVVTVGVAACSGGGTGSLETDDASGGLDGGIHEGGLADGGSADATKLPCNASPPAGGCPGPCPGDHRDYVCTDGTWTCPLLPNIHCAADAGCAGGPPPGSCHDACGGHDQGYVCEGGEWVCKAAQIPCDAGVIDAAVD